jgi:2-polyprenyl-3-methyl-5-hydroxy-6-metoxy-1,4-benzoquinol methylase
LEHLKHCPRCGSEFNGATLSVVDHSISKEVFELQDCLRCGFRATNPRPKQDEIGRYYESDKYISHTNAKGSLQDRLYQWVRKRALRKKHEIIREYQPSGRVLDIGCGTGQFLAYLMSRGYAVQGVEPSPTAREQAIADHGIQVVPSLDRISAQENLQVVTMWHVLEHVPDVGATFKKLFALLADRGLLVIAVPDRESWDAVHYGADWAAYDVPRHLSHFRRQDVRWFLQAHGFALIAVKPMWMDSYYIALLTEQYRGASLPVAFIKGALLGTWSNLISLISGRPTSSSMYLARKAEL